MEWLTNESDNYIFNYHVGSVAEKEIEEIMNLQETCYDFICTCLDVNIGIKIKYYLCNSPEEVGELYGDNEPCNGFARKPNEIYAVYNDNVKCVGFHEDAHIISYNIAIPPQTFMREGLAMFFDKVSLKMPNYAWVKFFINTNMYISIEELIINKNFYKYSDLITYPIAGAFTEYLISTFGIHKYKTFYSSLKKDNFESSFIEAFKMPISITNTKFVRYINSVGINDTIFSIIRNELGKRNLLKQQ
ncbi:hypothetical protein [Hathewaya massiliensis]|uniref:hypothetical protein n=1 Tax=Hathewaya massiliensis TaxID=1964382 RepID=UPI0011588FDA|nr:hypothetical protein [Hathewaya massiliensis]